MTPSVKPVVVIEWGRVVVLPSIGVRQHRWFLTHRPNCRTLHKREAAVVIGEPVYDGRCDSDDSNLIPSALSAMIMILLCMTVLRVM